MEILNIQGRARRGRSRILLCMLLIMGIAACRKKDSTVKLPKVDPKLVVISFICPQDTIIKATVTLTQPLYNNAEANQFKPVTNANVIISGNGRAITLVYDDEEEAYIGDPDLLQVTEGAVYNIDVRTPDGKHASASTSIPASNTSLTYNYSASSANVTAKWLDPVETTDYYRVILQRSSYFLFTGVGSQSGPFADTITTRVALAEWALDADYTGPEMEKTISFRFFPQSRDSAYLFLLHVSKEYYDYNTKLFTSEVNGNPFQEPSIMYTNMKGGLGVFAGFNGYRMEVVP